MRRSHCWEAKDAVPLLCRQRAHNPGKGVNMGKIKHELQLLVAWQDVVIQLLRETFLFELKIPRVLSFPGFMFTPEHISDC